MGFAFKEVFEVIINITFDETNKCQYEAIGDGSMHLFSRCKIMNTMPFVLSNYALNDRLHLYTEVLVFGRSLFGYGIHVHCKITFKL